jgi:hypothetical protein
MVGPGDDDEYVLEEGVLDNGYAFWRLPHDVEVALVLGQAREQNGAIGDLQARLDFRIAAHEAAEQMRHEILAGTHDVNIQRAGNFATQIVEAGFEVTEPFQYVFRGVKDFLPSHRQVQLLADVLNERHADLPLQALDLDRYGGLCQVHFFCGAGDALLLRDGDK